MNSDDRENIVRSVTQILLRKRGKSGRVGLARRKLLAWIGLLSILLLVVFVSLFMGKHRAPRPDSHHPSAATSDPSHRPPPARIANAPMQERDAGGSAIKKALASGKAASPISVSPVSVQAANAHLRRLPVQRRGNPVRPPTQTAAPTTGPGVSAPGGAPTAVVELDGESYELSVNQVGYFERVRVQPEQKIPVVVNCPDGFAGQYVVVEVEDGGLLDTGKIVKTVRLDERKQVAFTMQVSGNAGIHRVSLRRGANLKVLDLWVGPDVPTGQ